MQYRLDELTLSPELQSRVVFDEATIKDYAERYADGAMFPPVVAFRDGEHTLLADGFHRYTALLRNGVTEIDVDVREGDKADALLYAAGANATHGLRRRPEDIMRAVEMALEAFALRGEDPNHDKLAAAVGIARTTARRYRVLPASGHQDNLERRRSDGHLVTQHLRKPSVSDSAQDDQSNASESPLIEWSDTPDPNPEPFPADPDYRTGPLPTVTGDALNPAARAELRGFAAAIRGHTAQAQGVITQIIKDAGEPRLRMLLNDAETQTSWEETATQVYALLVSMEKLGIRPNQEKGVAYGQAYTR